IETSLKPEESQIPETPLWFDKEEGEETDSEKKEKKGCIGKFILILIILILIAEIASLGIKYFWPESQAAAVVTDSQVKIVNTLTNWKDGIVRFFKGIGGVDDPAIENGVDGKDDPEAEPVDVSLEGQEEDEPIPVDLISSQMEHNKNIETIRANDTLVYIPDRDYKVADINSSKPIESNIWMTANDGKAMYFDQEIVGTLIAFDSQWIDYVNGESDQVIHLTQKGSKAYRNVTTFSKTGKVKQTFTLLEIGEIRKGENGYYIWTYEEIEEVSGGKTYNKTYHWIYQMKPIDDEMKIINYFKY
ncbi:MAG: hypothetical protein PHE41_04640, partial [Eubacteriales bacterium]|nr:hypothetical protein [Eubacteriales bacterium]